MTHRDVTVYLPPSMRHFEPWRAPGDRWTEVLPLAFDLAEAVRPELLVGVGVGRGADYFSYCQSITQHDLPTVCYAVGSWDDEGAERDADELHHDFRDHNRYRHPGFSYPLRAPYAEAAEGFADGSVDLIHLSQDLTPTRVAGELRRWGPKLRPGGILVCCDVGDANAERRGEWERITAEADAFLFAGQPRLGVFRIPGGGSLADGPLLLRILFGEEADAGDRLRSLYARIARSLELYHRTDLAAYGRVTRVISDPDRS